MKTDVFSHFYHFNLLLETLGILSIFENILVLTSVRNCVLNNLSCKPKIFKKFEYWSYSNWIPNTKYRKPNWSDCTLNNGRIFRSNIVMKDLRIVFDQSPSVNIICKIESWNCKRNTTNFLLVFSYQLFSSLLNIFCFIIVFYLLLIKIYWSIHFIPH